MTSFAVNQSGRFVILTHDHPHLHWDFMLEAGDVLRTWRLAEPPAIGSNIPAEPLPDHRIEYLDYEGPVSGGRGTVTQFDAGTFRLLDVSGSLRLELSGRELRCTAQIGNRACLLY